MFESVLVSFKMSLSSLQQPKRLRRLILVRLSASPVLLKINFFAVFDFFFVKNYNVLLLDSVAVDPRPTKKATGFFVIFIFCIGFSI